MNTNLSKLFYPQTTAIIGASSKEKSIGYELTKTILSYGYKGDLYLTNPKSDSILGVKCYKNISDIPKPIDLAIVIVPKAFVEESIDKLIETKVGAIILITAGFKETGSEGAIVEERIKEKIKNITDSIEVSFGQRPFSFRSGRFGFNENIARVLVENSYMVDSSVTPYINWYKHKGIPNGIGGPDYLNNTAFPCRYDFNEKSLLEIPITILPTKFPLNKNENIAQYYFSHLDTNILFKTLRKILFQNQPVWLRPYPFMNIKLYRELLNEAIKRDLPYIVMMFHSSELMPGCSKYRPDADSVEKLFEELQTLFSMLRSKNIRSVTLTEAAKKVLL